MVAFFEFSCAIFRGVFDPDFVTFFEVFDSVFWDFWRYRGRPVLADPRGSFLCLLLCPWSDRGGSVIAAESGGVIVVFRSVFAPVSNFLRPADR